VFSLRLLGCSLWAGVTIALLLAMPSSTRAQSGPAPAPAPAESDQESAAEVTVATVRLDGRALFQVCGSKSRPASERARAIADRIAGASEDSTVSADSLFLVESEIGTRILVGSHLLLVVTDQDAQLDRLTRPQAVSYVRLRLRQAILEYRADRTPQHLLVSAGIAVVATLAMMLLLFVIVRLTRRFRSTIREGVKATVRGVKIQSLELVAPESVAGFLDGLLRLARMVAIVAVVFFYADFVLSLFPWTRAAATGLIGYVLDPLKLMGTSVINYLPNLLFLIVLVVVTRLVLGFLKLAATGISRKRITIPGFHHEWAGPTFQLLRFVVIAFAVVVAFPYIPGSSSPAFQGMSLFFGVLISLGSSSLVGNLVAGYTLIYWQAIRVGDRVQVGDVIGDVTATGSLVTRIRTLKHEEIVIPNSRIMSERLVNYTALCKGPGLILHTTVGIGYETPWRQVEAMLLMAAARTQGVLAEPKPYVLQRALGDFAITYEINAYTDSPQLMFQIYDRLYRNILDLFNEYGVQIMTPAYEGDPERAKVVPKDQWHAAPAHPGGGDASGSGSSKGA
jgi:small-conductance mechanosensitive channel